MLSEVLSMLLNFLWKFLARRETVTNQTDSLKYDGTSCLINYVQAWARGKEQVMFWPHNHSRWWLGVGKSSGPHSKLKKYTDIWTSRRRTAMLLSWVTLFASAVFCCIIKFQSSMAKKPVKYSVVLKSLSSVCNALRSSRLLRIWVLKWMCYVCAGGCFHWISFQGKPSSGLLVRRR